MLAVRRERHVLRLHRASGADLRGFLAQQRHPDAELALALQRVGLPVGPSDQHHVAVEAAQVLGRDVEVEVGMVHPLALRRQQLDQVFAAFGGCPQAGDDLLCCRPGRSRGRCSDR
jgi:hypothetical protein